MPRKSPPPFPMPADIRVGEQMDAYIKRVGVAKVPPETLKALGIKPAMPREYHNDTPAYAAARVKCGVDPKPGTIKRQPMQTIGGALTALDMGRALFQSDVGDKIKPYTVNACADVCSWLGRSLLGRQLFMGRVQHLDLDLQNGKWLRVTMVNAGAPADLPLTWSHIKDMSDMVGERDRLISALRPLVDMDTSERTTKTQGYNLRSPYAEMWDTARKLLKAYK